MNDLTPLPDPWAELYGGGKLRFAANHWAMALGRPESTDPLPPMLIENVTEFPVRDLPWMSPPIGPLWSSSRPVRAAVALPDDWFMGYGGATIPANRQEREAAGARTRDALLDPFATALPWTASACDRLPLGVRGLGVVPNLGAGDAPTPLTWRVPQCPPWSNARGRSPRRCSR